MSAITGTNFSVTAAIRLIPPKMIKPSSTESTAPVTISSIPKVAFKEAAILFTCGIFPVPNELIMAATAKSVAIHFIPSLFFM